MKNIVILFCLWFSSTVYSQCASLPAQCDLMRLEICEDQTLSLIDRVKNEISNGVLPNDIDTLYLSALSGDKQSQFLLGADISNSDVGSRMRNICWLTLSSELGVLESYHFIGKIYGDYDNALYDFDKAVSYYGMSIDKRSQLASDSYFELGLMYQSRDMQNHNADLSIRYHKLASELGHPEASYNLGVEYQTAGNVDSISRAVKYYNRSIESPRLDIKTPILPFAYNNLGVIYLTSDKFFNPSLSVSFFEKAVSAGANNANYYLGYIYAEGIGVEVDRRMAKDYFQVLALEGDAASMAAIDMYKLNDDF